MAFGLHLCCFSPAAAPAMHYADQSTARSPISNALLPNCNSPVGAASIAVLLGAQHQRAARLQRPRLAGGGGGDQQAVPVDL